MFNGKPILNVAIRLLVVIGFIALLGAFGTTTMHVEMMYGLRSCSQTLHLQL